MPRKQDREGIAGELSAIPALSREALIEQWVEAHGHPPPKGTSRRLLEYSAGYQIQMQALGGLKPAIRRKLRQLATAKEGPTSSKATTKTPKALPPGSRLVREWHGNIHTVDVRADGVMYDGRRYRSLSEVARAITGARWSGPRFFGL